MAHSTTYNDRVVRQFAWTTVIWGIVGMLVGVFIAAQLAWPFGLGTTGLGVMKISIAVVLVGIVRRHPPSRPSVGNRRAPPAQNAGPVCCPLPRAWT